MPSKPSTDRAAIGHIIDAINASDWSLARVFDGEEDIDTPTKPEAMEAILAVDDAFLHVEHTGNSDKGWIRFVMGNEPMEVVCDHTVNLSDVIDPVTQPWWE